jgi:ParB family chromosome partitioning protein
VKRVVTTVKISEIKPNPYQTREHIDPARVRELADEIKSTGFWEGLRARQVDGHYELVFGHRRLAALKLLGHKEVHIDVVKLDDGQMAMQALIENVQREGLNDIEKANGIKRLFDLPTAVGNIKKAADLLGYSEDTIREYLQLAGLDRQTQEAATKGGLSRTAIRDAHKIGGPEFVRVAAKAKLNRDDLEEISSTVSKLGPVAKRKIQEKLKSGKITKPEKVKREARRLEAKSIPRSKVPPDLHEVLIQWTRFIKQWRKELRAIEPYREYIDTDPDVAAIFRKEVAGLIEDLKALL